MNKKLLLLFGPFIFGCSFINQPSSLSSSSFEISSSKDSLITTSSSEDSFGSSSNQESSSPEVPSSQESDLNSSSSNEQSSSESISFVESSSQESSSSEISSSENSSSIEQSSSADLKYSLSLNASNSPSFVNETDYFVQDIDFDENHSVIFTYEKAHSSLNNHIKLLKGGLLKTNESLKGCQNISISFVGSIVFSYGYSNAFVNEQTLTNSTKTITLTDYFNYFAFTATSDTTIESIEFNIDPAKEETSYQYFHIYDDSYNLISTKEAKVGETVSLSSLPSPEKVYYEQTEIPFLGYGLEMDGEVLFSIVMPEKSFALYPIYDFVQRFSWDHDVENHSYTSLKKGVRAVSEVESTRYGRFSADFEVSNFSCTSIDLLFNLSLGPSSYPYEVSDGTTYYALHMNPTNGGFQLALDYGDNQIEAKWNPLISAYATNNGYWNSYWSNWYNSGNPSEPLRVNMSVEYSPAGIVCYVNDSYILSYTNATYLNKIDSPIVGVRANTNGVKTSNFTFVGFEGYQNGFAKFSDKSYSSFKTGSTLIDGFNGKYGKFESTIKVFNNKDSNSRTGILMRSAYEDGATPIWNTSGYYVHHHVTGNANFTLSSVYNNTYQGRPNSDTKANLAAKSYNSSSSPAVLSSYWTRNNDFYINKLTPFLEYKIALEITTNAINVYLDDSLILTHTTASNLTIFDSVEDNGVGILTQVAGVKFYNLGWTSYDA